MQVNQRRQIAKIGFLDRGDVFTADRTLGVSQVRVGPHRGWHVVLHQSDICQHSRPTTVAVFKRMNVDGQVVDLCGGNDHKIACFVVPFSARIGITPNSAGTIVGLTPIVL